MVWAAVFAAGSLWLAGCGGNKDTNATATPVAARTVPRPVSPEPEAPEAAAPIPRSVFSAAITDGRDPFFPDSVRRLPQMVSAAPTTKTTARPLPSSDLLKLSGLYPSGDRPLALINRTPMSPGEEAKVSVVVKDGPGGPESRKLLVRCLEVRPTSVVISVEGEPGTKELFLKSRL